LSENNGVLSKKDILRSIDDSETVYIETLGGKVRIRPISSGEYEEVQALEYKGLNTRTRGIRPGMSSREAREKTELNIDLAENSKNEFKANCLIAAYGLSVDEDEQWSVEEVRNHLPPGAPREIAERVREISGINPNMQERVENFRTGESESDGDSSPGQTGVQAGSEAAGSDTDTN